MEFKDLPDVAQTAACEVLKNNFPVSTVQAAQAKRLALSIRDAFISLYSPSENEGVCDDKHKLDQDY